MTKWMLAILALFVIVLITTFFLLPSADRITFTGGLLVCLLGSGGIIDLLKAFGVEVFKERKEVNPLMEEGADNDR